MNTRNLHVLLVVLLLGSLVCSSCGPKQTEEVKVVLTLPFADDGYGLAIQQAMEMALEEANHRAGDFTVTLEVNDSADENGWPVDDKEKAYAEAAVADPAVLVYIGSAFSASCVVSVPICNRAGLAQISTSATYPGLTKLGFAAGEPGIYYPSGKRTFLRMMATDDMQGPAAALWAQDLGLKRIYIVKHDDLYSDGLARAFVQTAESVGLTVVATSDILADQTSDLEGTVADIAAQQPDLVYFPGYIQPGIALFRALRDAGVTVTFMGGDSFYSPDVVDEFGRAADGTMSTYAGISVEDLGEPAQEFARRFKDRFGYELGDLAFNAIVAYDAMRIALAAIERAGKADRAAVLEALRETDFAGLVGHWSFDQNGDTNLMFIAGIQVENGAWKPTGLLRVR